MNDENMQQQTTAREENHEIEMGSPPEPAAAADSNSNNAGQNQGQQQQRSPSRAKQAYTSAAKFGGMMLGIIGAATGNDVLRGVGLIFIGTSFIELTDIENKIDAGAKALRGAGIITGISSIQQKSPVLGYAASAMIGIATGTEVAMKGASMTQRILQERRNRQNDVEEGMARA